MKNFLSKKTVRYLLLAIYLGVLLFVFLPHILHNIKIVDAKYIKDCTKTGEVYKLFVTDEKLIPKLIKLNQCDSIEVLNRGTKYHQIAFGEHPDHLAYPGYNEKPLAPGNTYTFVVKAYGNYSVHDHFHEEIEGEIIVTPIP